MNVMELFSLKGRVAFVVGGARDLGLDMATALGEVGADLIISSRDEKKSRESALKLAAGLKVRTLGLGLDATDEQQVQKAFAIVKKEFGRLDVLVNNVGGGAGRGNPQIEERAKADWDWTLKLNLDAMFLCTRSAIPIMKRQKSGSIINIASISGMLGRDRSVYAGLPGMHSSPDYQTAKAGVINFTRDLAAYLGAYGVRCNAISPGGFKRNNKEKFVKAYSRHTMLGRMGEDGTDLKGAVVLLASHAGAYITGHNLAVDGGFTAW